MKLRFLEVFPLSLSSFSRNLRAPRTHRGFGRAGTRATKWTTTRTTVRHISIPRREQQRLFPRSVLHYISTINRTTGTKLLSAPTNGLESTGNDTWFMVLLHARARATALEGLFKEELVRLQVHCAIARACTAKCVCRTEMLDHSSFRVALKSDSNIRSHILRSTFRKLIYLNF